MRKILHLSILLTAPVLRLAADDNVVLRWNDVLLTLIRSTRTPPPMATRTLAMAHTAMFDAWAAYDPTAVGTRLGDSLRRPQSEHTRANKETAISFAAYRVAVDLYAAQTSAIDTVMRSLGYNPADNSRNPSTPAGIGNTVAAALLAFRHADGSNQLGDLNPGAYSDYTGYQPINDVDAMRDPNRWQPLLQADGTPQRWLVPHWGRVVGFALKSGSQFRPGQPPSFSTELYDERCEDLRRMSARLTDKQKMITEYWEDGAGTETPPGHWNRIATAVSYRDGHTLDQDVRLFFALTNAQFDAGIAVWETKRFYDYIRPISAIRLMNRGKLISAWAGPGRGTQMIPGEQWLAYIATPPFADYVSGHSAFSAASAETLMLFTGSDNYGGSVSFQPGGSRIEPGVTPKRAITLRWATFSDAADEAGLSRRLGGIHFEDADIRARIMGRQIARQVWEKATAHIDGNSGR